MLCLKIVNCHLKQITYIEYDYLALAAHNCIKLLLNPESQIL